MSMAFIEDNGQWTVLTEGKSFTFNEDHINYDELVDCIQEEDVDRFIDLVDVEAHVSETVSGTDIEVKNGSVYYCGEIVHGDVVNKILEFYNKNLNFKPLCNFLRRLMKNPSKKSVDQLFKFLQNKNLAIAPDGRFLAYKSVRSNYMDKYSGKFDNSVGSVMKMERNQVDDDSSVHCSHGFHVGSLEYSGPGGWYNGPSDKVMIVAVDPAHAVSVPTDHSFQKLRVCEYEVVGHYDKPMDTVERYSEVRETNTKIYDIDDLREGMTVQVSDGIDTYVGEVVHVCTRSDTFEIESVVYYNDEEDTEIMEFDFYDCEVTCSS